MAFVSLFAGGIIYLLFRSNIVMLDAVADAGLENFLSAIKLEDNLLPSWVVYSLPDGLWMFSYYLIIGALWDFELKKCWWLLAILPSIAVIFEILQYKHLVPGTYDTGDIIAYLIGCIAGLLFYPLNKNKNKYEDKM